MRRGYAATNIRGRDFITSEPHRSREASKMSEDKIWYIALNDEQVGPLSQDVVRAEIEAGQVTGSTYIWRDGLEDWFMAADVDEFADAVSADEPYIEDVDGGYVNAFFESYDCSGRDDNDAAAASVAAARAGG